MPQARIFQRPKNATQSGRARTDEWVLEFLSREKVPVDPLTGWNGQADTQAQVKVVFPTLAAAQAYADRRGVSYHVVPAPQPKLKLQAYADNFR
ncbi:ETC complex I subunit [Sphingomonas sp. MAH-20]|uniref:ETC complex I subunit n=1 Tax=Sphingomonas horti TaxID=2682842 RepID=A0A6I4IYT5_9SPHN|nr:MULTISPECIES: NADH dehydrogenase ubiquinone Fe-S protein 4 [Sphingomonas]MBA2918412.1 ETC complex I subunit [Sphingomonas sp. CGMCC 1.13658]MVO77379.1 ETC complex I subunit [Sphingomonas horti]